jgi:hypothetical protein
MRKKGFFIFIVLISGAFVASMIISPVQANTTELQATNSAPTVTSTPMSSWITVRNDADMPQINVRSGPGTEYDGIGVLLMNQQAPALGRTSGGDWILIEYAGVPGSQGWVYSPLVILGGADLPIIEPPATPTPLVASTINPTLAAQFIVTSVPTRLPTYTQPAELVIPTFHDESAISSIGSLPMGLIISVLVVMGAILGLITLFQNR